MKPMIDIVYIVIFYLYIPLLPSLFLGLEITKEEFLLDWLLWKQEVQWGHHLGRCFISQLYSLHMGFC